MVAGFFLHVYTPTKNPPEYQTLSADSVSLTRLDKKPLKVAHFLRRTGWISVVGTPPEARGEGSSGVASRGVPESKHRGAPLKGRFQVLTRFQVLSLVSRLVSYLRKYSKKYLRPRLVSMAPPAENRLFPTWQGPWNGTVGVAGSAQKNSQIE